MKEKQIVMLDPSELKPYEKNPRKNAKAIDKVAASIREFGFKQPIVVDANRVVIVGHTRLEAAKRLKLTEVPVIIADDLTEAQAKAYRLADNKTNEFSEWDEDLLNLELGDITDIDMKEFGFDIKSPLNDKEAEEVDVPDAPEKPITKPGVLYKLGRHRLICGDSTKPETMQALLGGQKANLYLTDPPYGGDLERVQKSVDAASPRKLRNSVRKESHIANDALNKEEFIKFIFNTFTSAKSVLKLGSAFYCWFSSSRSIEFRSSIEESGYNIHAELIWVKNSPTLNFQDYHPQTEACLYGWLKGANHSWYADRKQTNVLKFDRPVRSDLHPTMKPVKLFDYLMRNSSKEGDIVLDSFGGSGTTIIAAEQNGRCGYCSELSEIYCDIIVQRYIDLVGSSKDIFVLDGDKEIPYEDYKKAMLELNKMEGDD